MFYSIDYYGPNDFATFYEAIDCSSKSKTSAICALLDIKPETLNRYFTGKSNPPKALVRLLFHESHFGRSATDAHTHEGHVLALRHAQGLQAEVNRLQSIIACLEAENDALKLPSCSRYTASNSPRWIA